jgi:hypothetical protein
MKPAADHTAAHSRLIADTRERYGREPGLKIYLNVKVRPRRVKGKDIWTAEPALGVGTSDLLCVLAPHGRLVALEGKTGTAKLTEDQQLFRDLIRSLGGFYSEFSTVEEAGACIERARKGATE